MLLTAIIVSIVSIVLGRHIAYSDSESVIIKKLKRTDIEEALCTVGGVVLFISVVAAIVLSVYVSYERVCNSELDMYIEENKEIEESMIKIVESYMEYEKDTYDSFKLDSNTEAMTVVSMFPELKSDVLIEKQMEVYINNNNKIKELKEKKINVSMLKWWLYFGK